MFKKWDIILIVLLICVSFIPELIFGVIMNRNYKGTYVEITLEGKFYKKIPLSEHRGEEEFNVKTKHGYNLIKIKDQSVSIIDADCPDKICEKPGFISKPGQSLVCLPHKLMVEVKSYDNKIDDDVIPAN
ncbi:NusG domain II-containing protein [Clostridium sp. DJ247]|uniref:NusG domain II-containing protein n=1 Tax=Clostridium sp. DJ247 TaxID=2726188 RepID=UPI0016287EF8|nr:NusG domain II-containing protein [Clostridium sp. DJ247]MBC2580946.1 NusG domain II-containing protein [Clostridium sp. DJ247]